jgi:3-oxoacyl-[acyl-carrier protein] reductase
MSDTDLAPVAVVVGDGVLAADLTDGLRARSFRVVQLAVRDGGTRAFFTEALDRIAEEHGAVDLLVHAHVHPLALRAVEIDELTERHWADACESTLDAAYRVAQAAHRHLTAGRGRLVYVVPTIGLTGAAGLAPFAAASEAIRALAKGIAKTWGKHGVTVNTIAYALSGDTETTKHSLVPPALGGTGDVETDLAPVIALLASPDAHFVTGSTLVLDGGIWTAL